MRLAELSAEERDFVCAPFEDTAFADALALHLSRLFLARTRQRVSVEVIAAGAGPAGGTGQAGDAGSHALEATDAGRVHDAARAAARPVLDWDTTLDTLWLQARLRGADPRPARGTTALTPNLRRMLESALAETWLSEPRDANLPPPLLLRIALPNAQARLSIRFPASRSLMQRWALEFIRSGHE